MDADRFDRLIVTLTRTRTRRSVLGPLAALGLTGLVTRDVAAQSCLENGEQCRTFGSPECCSGRCVRKGDTNKKFCRAAPGQGTCLIEFDNCVENATGCNNDFDCACYITTRGWSVCGRISTAECTPCQRDAQCAGRRSSCIPCPGTCPTEGTMCVRRCRMPLT